MKHLIRKMLMGDTVFSPYSKITIPDEIQERVYLETAGSMLDISGIHWILCIEPVVFGVWIGRERGGDGQGFGGRGFDSQDFGSPDFDGQTEGTEYTMYFNDRDYTGAGNIKRHAEAILVLDIVDRIEEKEGLLLLLRVKKSSSHHLSFLKTFLIFQRYYKSEGMPFGRFKSFAAAYSYPRRVRLISFRQDDYYNIFPMDLVGDISGHNRFVFGLRHTNTALPRIIETGRLVVSEVASQYKDIIVQLGRHHSGSPPALKELPFETLLSRQFGFDIPEWAERYKEITIEKSLDLGSHMLLWGRPVNEEVLTGPAEPLFFIHFLHYLHQKNKGLVYRQA